MKRVLLAKLLLLTVAQIPLPTPAPPSPARTNSESSRAGEGLIDGLVKKHDTGEPLSGVTVTLTGGPASFTDTFGPLTETTGSEGRFLFRNLPPGRYSITIRHDGYLFRRSLSGALDAGQVVVGPGRSTAVVAFSMVQGGI